MDKHDKNNQDLKELLITLLDEHNQLSARVNRLLKEDLSQTSNIVNDVIKNLINSFNMINKNLDSLIDNSNANAGNKINDETIIADIKSSINIIQRCLQFEDIVQQLIVHSTHLIEQKEKLLVKISDEIQKISTGQDYTVQNESLIRAIHAIKNSAEIIEKESPVQQSSLERGKIELF